jgi:cytochrome c553
MLAISLIVSLGNPLTGEAALLWESQSLQLRAQPGGTNVAFAFRFTNSTAGEIVIREVKPSCGCTLLQLPPLPWTIKPGASGAIKGGVDLRGKHGALHKAINVLTSQGAEPLEFHVTIPETLAARREQNITLAQADRQAVFKGDCARCHVPAPKVTTSLALYASACGICHDAPTRASMVPDLRHVSRDKDAAYWARWIREGKAGTLMPGFAQTHGGPLDEAQIRALVECLATLSQSGRLSEIKPSPAAGPGAFVPRPAPPVAEVKPEQGARERVPRPVAAESGRGTEKLPLDQITKRSIE